jgi:ribonuclease HI
VIGSETGGGSAPSREREADVYTDGVSTGSRGPGGYGAVIIFRQGTTVEISSGEQYTTNMRMEVTAACVALEAIDEGYAVTVYSDASYLVNCMRWGWYEKWRENAWLNHREEPVANRDLREQAPRSDAAPPGNAVEEGQRALQESRSAQELERPGRRACRDREE